MRRQSERDLIRAELIAFPLLLLLGSGSSAAWSRRSLPVAAGVLSIVTTLAMLRLANRRAPISVFALNLVTGAGLGLAIDYSLLLVSRYREELARSRAGAQALRMTVADGGTHGRVQRGHRRRRVRVAARVPARRSCARWRSAGLIVAPLAGLVALTRLPALFALLGTRVERARAGQLAAGGRAAARPDERGGWYRFAHWVMR